MDHSEHGENKHKIFKYTDKDGHVHYVDENGNPVKDENRLLPKEVIQTAVLLTNIPHRTKRTSEKRNIPEKQEKNFLRIQFYLLLKKKKKKKKKKERTKNIFAVFFILMLAAIGICIGAWISIIKALGNKYI